MPRIDRYILKNLLTLFGFFSLVLVSVYWINRAVSLFEQLISDGQTALVVLEFTALTLPYVIATMLPVAAFAASAYGTNRLSSESELVAMQSAGLSPWRLARPVLYFGLVVGLMVALLVHGLVPMSRARLAERQAELAQDVTAQFFRPGNFQFPGKGITLFIRSVDASGEIEGLFLEDARRPDDQTTYTAEHARLIQTDTGPRLAMRLGMVQNLKRTDGQWSMSVTRFDELTYDIGAMFVQAGTRKADLRTYSTLALLGPDDAMLAATGSTRDQSLAEAHERIAKPLLSPVAALLGFAALLIGGYSRFGVWRQVIWAVVAMIAIQFLNNAAADQVGRDSGQWPLLYVAPLSGAVVAAAMLWLAACPRGRLFGKRSPA